MPTPAAPEGAVCQRAATTNLETPAYDFTPADKVVFRGLKSRNTETATPSKQRDYISDLYIFAFQNGQSPAMWDATDLSQWEFYIRSPDELSGSTVSLKQLRAHKAARLSAEKFVIEMKIQIAMAEARKKESNSR